MLTEERRRFILDRVQTRGRVIAKDLATELNTSEDTVRRDLRTLAAEGHLTRVHGGALAASPAVRSLEARRTQAIEEKVAIGRAAAGLISSGQVVFLDGGTSTLHLVRQLDRNLKGTIITHSPVIGAELADHAIDVVMIGGPLFKHSMVAVGTVAAQMIASVRADIYFMGVTGIDPEIGLSTGDWEEAAIKRALIAASGETVVLASRDKIGAASPFVIAPVSSASTMLVATSMPPEETQRYESHGITVMVAQEA